jgi:hypothetical protein
MKRICATFLAFAGLASMAVDARASEAAPAAAASFECADRFSMQQIVELASRQHADAIVVGEIHGTTEAPAAFLELVCARLASDARPLVVGVELSSEAVDKAREAAKESKRPASSMLRLRQSAFWAQARDGRTSHAYFELLERLFEFEAMGKIKIVGFDRRAIDGGGLGDSAADYLRSQASDSAFFLALVGRGHSVFDGTPDSLVDSLAHRGLKTTAVQLSFAHGQSWACSDGACKVYPVTGAPCQPHVLQPSVTRRLDALRTQAWYCLGPASASQPELDFRRQAVRASKSSK